MTGGITSSGLDIVTFALLVLAFRVCEKVATPTSVILMGTNALFAVVWGEATPPACGRRHGTSGGCAHP